MPSADPSLLAPAGERPARDLTEPELRALVQEFAAHPERWAHLVDHDPDQRHYELLVRDDHVAVWLICWMEDHDTGFHDHDVSAGAVAVVGGCGGGGRRAGARGAARARGRHGRPGVRHR